jgi:hypothetical protein
MRSALPGAREHLHNGVTLRRRITASKVPSDRVMTHDIHAFIHRLLMQVLPQGCHRIRYYGWLTNRREEYRARARLLAGPLIPGGRAYRWYRPRRYLLKPLRSILPSRKA